MAKTRRGQAAKAFYDRMKRDGQWKRYVARRNELNKTIKHFRKANCQTMREFGYAGVEEELLMQEEFEKVGIKTTAELQRVRDQDAIKDEQVNESFDEVFDNLPEVTGGTLKESYVWVANHPLVMKAQRHLDDPNVKIRVEANHIKRAPNKWAATSLVTAVTNPKEFRDRMNEMLKHEIKRSDVEDKDADDTAPQIDMLDQWLKDNQDLGAEDDYDRY